jgi:hypothetical protein
MFCQKNIQIVRVLFGIYGYQNDNLLTIVITYTKNWQIMNFEIENIYLTFKSLSKISLPVLKSIFRLYATDTKGLKGVGGQTVLLVN